MKIMIDASGFLHLGRKSGMVPTGCPYTSPIATQKGLVARSCGDWCPMFVEPTSSSGADSIYKVQLACNRVVIEGELIDMRPEHSTQEA